MTGPPVLPLPRSARQRRHPQRWQSVPDLRRQGGGSRAYSRPLPARSAMPTNSRSTNCISAITAASAIAGSCARVCSRMSRPARPGSVRARAGGHVGEQAGADALAQPVQRAARLAGGGDRVEHAAQLRGDDPGAGREQIAGAAAQGASRAAAFLIKPVFGAAVGAGVCDRDPRTVRARVSGRARRDDQPPLLAAGCAPAPAAQRGGVTRVADRPFGPAGCRRGWIVASAVDGAAVVIGHLPAGLRPGAEGWPHGPSD
jgi:hypothetical protein